MLRICYYISDYGYGHASRSIAVIRRLLGASDSVEILVKSGFPFSFLSDSLPQKRVKVFRCDNDIGVELAEGSTSVDVSGTRRRLDGWLKSWDEYMRRESRFCSENRISLILSDVAPQPFMVARDLGIPSIGVSNFTWYDIFHGLFGECEATEKMREAYGSAGSFLVLPFNDSMGYLRKAREVGLVSRDVVEEKTRVRKRLGVAADEKLVFLGIGKSMAGSFLAQMTGSGMKGTRFLVSSGSALHGGGIVSVPERETETQDFIAACDLVVTKSGYSTVAEAIRGSVPIFLLKRKGFSEDDHVEASIVKNRIGKVISEGSFLGCKWADDMESLNEYRGAFASIEDRLRRDGTREVVDSILELAAKL